MRMCLLLFINYHTRAFLKFDKTKDNMNLNIFVNITEIYLTWVNLITAKIQLFESSQIFLLLHFPHE